MLGSHVYAQPIIYAQPAYQSPVRGEPDDLLLLPGYGFSVDDTVVYRQIDSTDKVPSPPESLPSESTAHTGVVPVVSNNHTPYSLTVRLPEVLTTNQTYALWAHNSRGEWSNPVLINDARPLWVSPAYVYASQPMAALPRYLKVIGRNLQPASGKLPQVRLSGPQLYVLSVQSEQSHRGANEYSATVSLPERISPGTYQVEFSRDDTNWASVDGQMLEVRKDPATMPVFNPGETRFGACRADDGRDDAKCLQLAINSATIVGGVVQFDKGQWDLIDARALGTAAREGLRIPRYVSLRGSDQGETVIARHTQWNADVHRPTFTVEGDNSISGFHFTDLQRYTHRTQAAPFIKLGSTPTPQKLPPASIENVVVTGNVFDKVMLAIADSGAPIRNLFVTFNDFGAYHESIRLAGDASTTEGTFRIDDSIIANNHFYPGSWIDVNNRQGALATEFGAGHRLDFSDNVADGSSDKYLNNAEDAHGWRAGFFWHLNGNQEQLLISGNTLTCTGDKVGDGEAIAFDNNGNTFAVDSATDVIAATATSITVRGSLISHQYNHSVLDGYYIGHWVQIGAGPGLGQVRKIIAYRRDGENTILSITPTWDVVPTANATQISIGREFWQVYAVGNKIDHRQPTCLKSNRNNPKGGGISLFAQMADSVVAYNQQFDSDGILVQNQFTAHDDRCNDCYRGNYYISFVDIHHNLIDGEYDWDNSCSSSGIIGSLAAGPNSAPLTTNYGLNIARNVIKHADAWRGGAISMTPSWYQGPPPHQWALVEGALIQHNMITEMWAGPAQSCGAIQSGKRTGISLGNSSLVWRSVLYANTCAEVPQAMFLTQITHTERLCKRELQNACECKL
ncbi:MAG: hypothetical protein AB7U99_05965 [Steroidobacteraceae bacterium]